MLTMSAEALAVVQRSFVMRMRVESWLGDTLLADDVPVADGSESRDRSMAVPEQIQLSVPRLVRGASWDPLTPDHPLAAYGQRLRISYGVEVAGEFEWINRGWFQITSTSTDGDTVSVQAEGLLTLINEARFVSPFQPSGTFVSTLRSLVEPALTITVDGSITDRAVPVGMQWDDDRIGAVGELLDAWPAAARVTEDGVLAVEPVADPTTPVLAITDGTGGTVVRWQGDASRDGAFNVVVAQGEDATGLQVQGTAYDTDTASPYRVGGPFNPLPVPYVYSSPLLTTVAQCRAAAQTRLRTLRRTAFRKLSATIVPHPGLLIGDVVAVTGAGMTAQNCVIESMALPYSPGDMQLTLQVVGGG